MNTILLKELNVTYNKFIVPLRMGDGFDEESFLHFCHLVSKCANEWKDTNVIPKQAANIFIDAYSAMISITSLYDENIAEKINQSADYMNDLIRQCVN
jgi:hypothetical protein